MEPWKTLEKRIVFDAPPYVQVSCQRIALPDGNEINDFYQVHLRPMAVTVPFLEDGTVLMTRAYKHGPGRVCLSFPGGFVEPDETAQAGAAREMMEETGYTSDNWTALGQFTDNGNQKGCQGSYFVATGCHAVGLPDDGDLEETKIERHTPEAIDAFLRDGMLAVTHHAAAWAFARLWMRG